MKTRGKIPRPILDGARALARINGDTRVISRTPSGEYSISSTRFWNDSERFLDRVFIALVHWDGAIDRVVH